MDEYLVELAADLRKQAKNLKDRARAIHVEAVHLEMLADELDMKITPEPVAETPEQPRMFGQKG